MIAVLPVALIRALLGKDPWRGQWTKDWLTEPLTIDDVDAGFERIKAVGGDCEKWNQMKTKVRPSDEIWAYKSPPDTWHRLCGREGICLKRDGEIIESIVTSMN